MHLILGSSSLWRRALWTKHFGEGHTFLSPDIDEQSIRHEHAADLTLLIANAKADALVARLGSSESLLVCMDQVVRCEGVIREKPQSEAEARRYLETYSSGAAAECISGIVVHNLQTGRRVAASDFSSVRFSPIAPELIDTLIAKGDVYTSAGGFAIDDPLLKPCVADINGGADAVQGLPLRTLRQLLERASTPPSPAPPPTAPPQPQAPPPRPVASGVRVSVLRRGDADEAAAARALFAAGMTQTIERGLRAELLRPTPTRLGLLAGVPLCGAWLLTRLLGVAPRGAASAAFGAALALLGVAAVQLPRYHARAYVEKCLADDMAAPWQHYCGRRGGCFWVAKDEATGEVLGTVAVEPLDKATREALGAGGGGGAAELRRMSVASSARRRGVARALLAALTRHCAQLGYGRVVLDTSTLQAEACALYERVGFERARVTPIFGHVRSHRYVMRLEEG